VRSGQGRSQLRPSDRDTGRAQGGVTRWLGKLRPRFVPGLGGSGMDRVSSDRPNKPGGILSGRRERGWNPATATKCASN